MKSAKKKYPYTNCIENDILYEPIWDATHNDSIRIQAVIDSSNNEYHWFNYELLDFVRGKLDTTLLNNINNEKYHYIKKDYRREISLSPLIAIGEVVEQYATDTSKGIRYKFITNLQIKLKKIINSKYSLRKNDIILAKLSNYGKVASFENGTKHIYEILTGQPFFYQVGKDYLFVLDRTNYSFECLLIKNKMYGRGQFNDIYCPYSFYINSISNIISNGYENNEIDIATIQKYLNNE